MAQLDARALIVRSVTRVDAALLAAAPGLGFVGTATAGVDHLERPALAARGVQVASAAGCNARAVAEWVATALLTVRARGQLDDAIFTGPIGLVGLVGLGEVGSRVARVLVALGYAVIACDPPLVRERPERARALAAELDLEFVDLPTLWRRCTIVSLHVPLIREGRDQTLAMITPQDPAPAGPKLLINTCRGPVVPDRALDRPDLAGLILDVWAGEPTISARRLADPRLHLASPHVAGYSLEGKVRATAMMHRALSSWLGVAPSWAGAELLPPVALAPAGSLLELLHQVVDLPGDDARVRALAALSDDARAPAFEALRRGYRLRREFRSCQPPPLGDPAADAILRNLGLRGA
nr:NAD(P)-dependent oxidoreductase [Pseudenhygromyxa sp. WMMC2535]